MLIFRNTEYTPQENLSNCANGNLIYSIAPITDNIIVYYSVRRIISGLFISRLLVG